MSVTFESKVREHREAAGLTQEELARRVDVTRQTIINIEQGLNQPRVLLALAIAGVFGVLLLSDLFGEVEA